MATTYDAALRPVSPIFSFSALKSNQREIKNRGREEVVHITENGNAAFIFCSEDVFEREKARAVENAICEMQVAQMIERGRADIEAGRAVEGLEAAQKRMNEIWNANA